MESVWESNLRVVFFIEKILGPSLLDYTLSEHQNRPPTRQGIVFHMSVRLNITGGIDIIKAKSFFEQMCSALQYTHSRGYCHRCVPISLSHVVTFSDIKLDNFVLDQDLEFLSVIDWGHGAAFTYTSGSHSPASSPAGSPAIYFSPLGGSRRTDNFWDHSPSNFTSSPSSDRFLSLSSSPSHHYFSSSPSTSQFGSPISHSPLNSSFSPTRKTRVPFTTK